MYMIMHVHVCIYIYTRYRVLLNNHRQCPSWNHPKISLPKDTIWKREIWTSSNALPSAPKDWCSGWLFCRPRRSVSSPTPDALLAGMASGRGVSRGEPSSPDATNATIYWGVTHGFHPVSCHGYDKSSFFDDFLYDFGWENYRNA